MFNLFNFPVICDKSVFGYPSTSEYNDKFLKSIKNLEKNILVDNLTHCWNWQRYLDKDGYGEMKIFYKSLKVHRIVYLLCIGELLKLDIVRHTCDNTRCCNPQHLIKGTYQENTLDMIARNRSRSNISLDEAKIIVSLHKQGVPQTDIAIQYDEAGYTISRIIRGVGLKDPTREIINTQIKTKKYPCGSKSHSSKVKEEQVITIRRQHFVENLSYPKLGEMYDMSASGIQGICRGTTWKSVPFEDYDFIKNKQTGEVKKNIYRRILRYT